MVKMRFKILRQLSIILLFPLCIFAETLTISGTTDTKDATIRSVQHLNWGGYPELRVGPGAGQAFKALCRFDYSSILGVTVNSAICSLYCSTSAGGNTDIEVSRVVRDWREGTASVTRQDSMVTWYATGEGLAEDGTTLIATATCVNATDTCWSIAGLDFPDDVDDPSDTVTVTGTGWWGFDVTSIVQDQLASGDNRGFFFRLVSGTGNQYFASSEAVANIPFLYIDFTAPPTYQPELIIIHDE